MARLSANEIYAVARQAGFSPAQATTMTAIALAESGGNTDAHNPNGEDSRGLWQINVRAHGEKYGNLYDPLANARAAFAVSGGGATISPWTVTHQSKGAKYVANRAAAEAAAAAAGEPAQGNWSGSRGYGTTTPAGEGGGQAWSGATPSGTMTAMANNEVPTSPEDYAKSTYGYLAAFLEHPEVGPILLQGAKEKWSEARLRGALVETNWWKTTNESARQWMALEAQDPQEATSRINATAAAVMARANQLGYPLTNERALIVAKDAQKFGWQGAELDRAIGNEVAGGVLRTSTFGQKLRGIASSYAIPLSDQSLEDWADNIAKGNDTEEDFTLWARDMAKSMFPTIAAHLDRGGTTEQFFDPYRQDAAQTLGINPAEIDFSDPKWSAALSQADPNGERRALRRDEWVKLMKTDSRYGYEYTQNAKNEAEEWIGGLERMFGVRA